MGFLFIQLNCACYKFDLRPVICEKSSSLFFEIRKRGGFGILDGDFHGALIKDGHGGKLNPARYVG
jgi:hypothetical protein